MSCLSSPESGNFNEPYDFPEQSWVLMVSEYRWSGCIRSLLPYVKVIAEDALSSGILVWC